MCSQILCFELEVVLLVLLVILLLTPPVPRPNLAELPGPPPDAEPLVMLPVVVAGV